MESSKIYLCRADCSILGNISGLKAETCSLKKHAVGQWEITFDVERYTNDNSCELRQSDYYDSINTMMRLYLDGKEQVFFVIDSEPVIKGEGLQEIKTVTAHSIECELSAFALKNFKINCGTKDSQEYLATDPNGNFNNIDSYTNLPYEYISLVNYDNPQLSLLHLALLNTGWTVDENIDPEICSIKKNFDVSGTNIYDFLTNTVSPSASVIFQFDRKNKKVGLVKAGDFGEDTGIFATMRSLMNSFEITSSTNDDLITRMVPTGADNLGIEQVNFGKNYITNLDYFMNTLNEYGDYKYVSKELHDKYMLWKNYREKDKVTFNGKQCTRRELYVELSKLYNKAILDINDLKNRVPNDGAVTDYKTFSLEELKLHLNAFNKALVSLITLYKNEYGVSEMGNAPNYTPTPSSAINIKNTPYWHDFYAYKESIIPQIEEALKMYCQTDSNGNLMTDANGHFIEMEFGNPAYYADPSIVKEIDAYKYEWSLYGLDELESKKKAWCEVANLLFNECFILSGTVTAPTTYRTPDDNGWNSLSPVQKKEFTSKSAYIDKLNQYLDYMSFDLRNNSLTKTKCKGIIRQCEDAIMSRKNEIASLETLQNSYQTQRIELANSVSIENFKVNNTLLFTEKDLDVINSMIREQDYNNSNILTTNLDDIVSSVDAQEELYQAASEELYKLSQPQYSFSTDMDNLYALEEFQCYHDDFEVGNFIRVGFEIHEELFDNEFIKLRLISINYNPLDISSQNMSVEFSTMIKELDGVSDLASLFGESSSSSGSSSSGSSSSGSGGTYGNNDANVQMSNNMINALLSTELFGTTVTDVILDSIKANKGNFNTLLSHSGVFDSLEAGKIKVSGDCLFDHIKSSNYVEGKSGTMMNLIDGSFSFAAGALTYNPQSGLIIQGVASDDSLQSLINGLVNGNTIVNGSCITTGYLKSSNWNGSDSNLIGNTHGSIICLNDGKFNLGGGKLKWDGENLQINGNGKFTGEIQGTSGTFYGNITATTLTANQSGIIAGWTFDENGFYKENAEIGKENSMFLGETGISVGDYFIVDRNRFVFKDKNYATLDNVESIDFETCKTDSRTIPQITQDTGVKDDDCIVVCFNCNYSVQRPNLYGIITINQEGISGNSLPVYSDYVFTLLELNEKLDYYRDIERDIEMCVFLRKIIDIADSYNSQYIALFKLGFCDFSFDDSSYFEITKFDAIDHEELINVSLIYDGETYSYPINQFNIEKRGMSIDSYANKISINDIEITGKNIIAKNNYSIQFGKKDLHGTIFSRDGISFYNDNIYQAYGMRGFFSMTYGIKSPQTYSDKVSGKSLYINSDGLIGLSSSSKRFKNSISTTLSEVSNPHGLYDIDIVQYKYNNDYFSSPNDEGIGKYFIGFIAENVAEKFKDGATFDNNGLSDGWDIRYMFPAALKLIQEQYHDIQELKKNAQGKNREIKNLQKEIEAMKQQFQELKSCIINQ